MVGQRGSSVRRAWTSGWPPVGISSARAPTCSRRATRRFGAAPDIGAVSGIDGDAGDVDQLGQPGLEVGAVVGGKGREVGAIHVSKYRRP